MHINFAGSTYLLLQVAINQSSESQSAETDAPTDGYKRRQ